MFKCLYILGVLCLVSQGEEFRYDYNFDGQADGWFKFHIVPGTWREARMRCHAEGAVLASPLNKQLRSAIISYVATIKGSVPTTIFTGVHASFSKGDYSSIEGVPLGKMAIAWAPGEPDNYDNAESCLTMRTDKLGSISDSRCGDVFPYVCYKKKTQLTMTGCGTTDPAYTLDARTGSCYKFHKRALVWTQAYMTCVAEGGHLVIINSELEAKVVEEIYAQHPDSEIVSISPATVGIGFHDWGEHGTYTTIHGQTLDEAGYQRWSDNQPDNGTKARTDDTGEFCGSAARNARLNDVWCNVPIPFLCEKSRDSLLKL